MTTPSWDLWAHRGTDERFYHVGERWWVKLHGLDLPVVPVRVTPDPNGGYWGWLDVAKPAVAQQVPKMIQPHLGLLSVCFPYGLKAAEEAGQGQRIQLRIEPREESLT